MSDYFSVELDFFESARAAVRRFGAPATRLDAVPVDTFDECPARSSNPVFELDGLLDVVDQEVGARTQVRPEVVAAREQTATCERGSVIDDEGSATEQRVLDVVGAASSGEITEREALSQLDALEMAAAKERARFIEDCGVDLAAVLDAAVADEQEVFLERHPEFMRGLADEFSEQLALLVEYLPDRASHR